MNKSHMIDIAVAPEWPEYELIDTGNGAKLERFGPYQFVRPEAQAMWQRTLPQEQWDNADAVFNDMDTERGTWKFRTAVPERWQMTYHNIHFWAQATPFRHVGVFPEQSSQWDWMEQHVTSAGHPLSVLNLFGYTGIASLLLAAAGAKVTHVDASKKIVAWASDNQRLSGLSHLPIRWIVDDALKFVQREQRRGVRYDVILLDPPKFGRGPKGEVWKLEDSLLQLLQSCRAVLSDQSAFMILTSYALRLTSLSMTQLLAETMNTLPGSVQGGELVLKESSSGKLLSQALFARWSSS